MRSGWHQYGSVRLISGTPLITHRKGTTNRMFLASRRGKSWKCCISFEMYFFMWFAHVFLTDFLLEQMRRQLDCSLFNFFTHQLTPLTLLSSQNNTREWRWRHPQSARRFSEHNSSPKQHNNCRQKRNACLYSISLVFHQIEKGNVIDAGETVIQKACIFYPRTGGQQIRKQSAAPEGKKLNGWFWIRG